MDFWYALVGGLIIGFVFGFILQRGRFCMNSAFRDILLLKEFKLAKAVTISLAVLMVGFAIFAFGGVIDLYQASPPGIFEFKPWGAIVGGLVFGIGMILAAGCASGTTYRVGEGMMGSFVAAVGLTTGALMTKFGPLVNAKNYLNTTNLGKITLFGIFDATLTPVFMIIVGIVGLALMFFFWGWPAIKKKRDAKEPLVKPNNFVESTFKKGWPWWVTGIAIGIVLIAGYLASNGVIGITGGWMDINLWITSQDSVMWTGFIIFGIILGAMVSAIIAKEFKFRVPKDGFTIFKQFIGGGLMGFGAVTAAGCNVTNILGGVPQLSLHSIVTGAFIMIGCWIAAYLLFMWRQD
jgi:uncharacterized membrane protein YedE/YeeE